MANEPIVPDQNQWIISVRPNIISYDFPGGAIVGGPTINVVEGSATLVGVAVSTVSGARIQAGGSNLIGVGKLSGSGALIEAGSSTPIGVASLGANGATLASAQALLIGVGSLSADAEEIVFTPEVLYGPSVSPGKPRKAPTAQVLYFRAELQGRATLTAIGSVIKYSKLTRLQGAAKLKAYPIVLQEIDKSEYQEAYDEEALLLLALSSS